MTDPFYRIKNRIVVRFADYLHDDKQGRSINWITISRATIILPNRHRNVATVSAPDQRNELSTSPFECPTIRESVGSRDRTSDSPNGERDVRWLRLMGREASSRSRNANDQER